MHYLFVWLSLLFFSSQLLAGPGKFSLFLKGFKTSSLINPRDIYIYLPPEYARVKNKTYPVLYMQDGQNLFDPTRAFLGQTWHAETTLNRLISQGLMRSVIVVAVDNTRERTFEYTPDQDPSETQPGGGAGVYLNLITKELKPRIDASFRTKKDRKFTAIMGSSLGGLVSLSAGLTHSKTFGLVAALSPSIWWNSSSVLESLFMARQLPVKIYIDSGDSGGEKPYDVIRCSDVLQQRGFSEGSDLKTVIQSGATHSEKFWAQRFPLALHFLFPPN